MRWCKTCRRCTNAVPPGAPLTVLMGCADVQLRQHWNQETPGSSRSEHRTRQAHRARGRLTWRVPKTANCQGGGITSRHATSGRGRPQPAVSVWQRTEVQEVLSRHSRCAVVGGVTELDVAALADDAIETGDWAAVDPYVDRALKLFVRGGPLEHVRFCDDLGSFLGHELVDLTKLCTTGWLQSLRSRAGPRARSLQAPAR